MTPADLARQAAALIESGDHDAAVECLEAVLQKLARRPDPSVVAAEIRAWAVAQGIQTAPADTLALQQAARYLGVEAQSLRNAARRYGLPLLKINGRTRVSVSDLAAHVIRQMN
ncbi:MAG TPA: helix-turn-helix domain-containing protein [Castellaniella sp.]|nr:helix-turn-helix domain-containing protein [Castellaniella sp.]